MTIWRCWRKLIVKYWANICPLLFTFEQWHDRGHTGRECVLRSSHQNAFIEDQRHRKCYWIRETCYHLFGSCLLDEICTRANSEGLFTQKNPRTPPNKFRKIWKKIQGFIWEFKIRAPYLGVKNHSILVFKSFFIFKILERQKKNFEKSEKKKKNPRNFCEDLKSLHLIWEWLNPQFQCLNPFFIS